MIVDIVNFLYLLNLSRFSYSFTVGSSTFAFIEKTPFLDRNFHKRIFSRVSFDIY